MSATPIPYTNLDDVSCPGSAARERRAADPAGLALVTSGCRVCGAARGGAAPRPGHESFRSALDIGRPGLFDQLDHRVRHRNVVELLGRVAALGESPFEELDGLGGWRLIARLLVHRYEGLRGERPGRFARLVGQD